MKAVIVCGGSPPNKNLIEEELKDCNILIAADKGMDVLYEYGINPDIILGDFDSASKKSLSYFKQFREIVFETFPVEKDFTDSFAALRKAMNLNADEICFLGCIGTRMDHVLGNIGLLYEGLKNRVKCYIRDEHNYITLVDESTIIYKDDFKYFSLQSYGSTVKSITLNGAMYELNNYDLNIGESLSISNEFKEDTVKINFKKGLLLIIKSRD